MDAGVPAVEEAEFAGAGDGEAIGGGAEGEAGPIRGCQIGAGEHVEVDSNGAIDIGGGEWEAAEAALAAEGEEEVVAVGAGGGVDVGGVSDLDVADAGPGLEGGGAGLAIGEVVVPEPVMVVRRVWAEALEISRVPLVMVVVPVWLTGPERVRVPVPDLERLPEPVISPVRDWEELLEKARVPAARLTRWLLEVMGPERVRVPSPLLLMPLERVSGVEIS